MWLGRENRWEDDEDFGCEGNRGVCMEYDGDNGVGSKVSGISW